MKVTAKQVAQKFIERAGALSYKGVKRDNAALDFFCGAATALEAAGLTQESHNVGMCAAMLVSVRGYMAVKELAAAQEELQ